MARAQPLVDAQPNVDKLVEDHLAVQSLIRAYQVRLRPLAASAPVTCPGASALSLPGSPGRQKRAMPRAEEPGTASLPLPEHVLATRRPCPADSSFFFP